MNHPTIAGETLVFVNDGTNVFREVDNGVPMKYASNTWTGSNVFSGTVGIIECRHVWSRLPPSKNPLVPPKSPPRITPTNVPPIPPP